jgi:hypothetical protein
MHTGRKSYNNEHLPGQAEANSRIIRCRAAECALPFAVNQEHTVLEPLLLQWDIRLARRFKGVHVGLVDAVLSIHQAVRSTASCKPEY